jgi:hypothetical protein
MSTGQGEEVIDHGLWLEGPDTHAYVTPGGTWLVINKHTGAELGEVGLRDFAINACRQRRSDDVRESQSTTG